MRILWISCFFVSVLGAQVSDRMLTRVRGTYDVGEGIGYRDGFTSLETFWGLRRQTINYMYHFVCKIICC